MRPVDCFSVLAAADFAHQQTANRPDLAGLPLGQIVERATRPVALLDPSAASSPILGAKRASTQMFAQSRGEIVAGKPLQWFRHARLDAPSALT